MLIVRNFNFYIYLVFVSRKIKVKFDFGHYVKQKKFPPNSGFCWEFILLSHFVIIFVLFCFLVLSLFSCFVQVLYERLGGCYFFSSFHLFIFCTKLAKSLVIILFFW
jgi:hypothetical protein